MKGQRTLSNEALGLEPKWLCMMMMMMMMLLLMMMMMLMVIVDYH